AVQRLQRDAKIKAEVFLELCTYNSRSLQAKVAMQETHGRGGRRAGRRPAYGHDLGATINKRLNLAAQFADMGVHVVALQHTISDGEVKRVGQCTCCSSGCQDPGKGCAIWVNATFPFAVQGQPQTLDPKKTLLFRQPDRISVLRTEVPTAKITIASVHAPRDETDRAEKDEFWDHLSRLTSACSIDIVMGGMLFNFAAAHYLEVVNTAKDRGSASFAHVASRGQRHRLDCTVILEHLAKHVLAVITDSWFDKGVTADGRILVLATMRRQIRGKTTRGEFTPDNSKFADPDATDLKRGLIADNQPSRLYAPAKSITDGTLREVANYIATELDSISHAIYWFQTQDGLALHAIMLETGPPLAYVIERGRRNFLSALAAAAKGAQAKSDAYGSSTEHRCASAARNRAARVITAQQLADKYNQDNDNKFFQVELQVEAASPCGASRYQMRSEAPGPKGGPDGLTSALLRTAPRQCADMLRPLSEKAAVTGYERTLQAHREIMLNSVLGKHHHMFYWTVLNGCIVLTSRQ
ncbi:unnamed protein product, partial [Prorocentrum cordatum]